jgi:hypothetical protein
MRDSFWTIAHQQSSPCGASRRHGIFGFYSRNRLVCLPSEFCARLKHRQKIKADPVFLGDGCAFIALLFNHTVLWTHGGEHEVLRMAIGRSTGHR